MKDLKQLRNWCRETFHYYVVFKNSIYFILGLLLSYKLVEKTLLNILIARLSDLWKSYDLRRAIAVVNFREGTSAILLPLFAYVADVYTGRFRMIFCSTAVCIIGLLLNVLATKDDVLNILLFFSSLLLITLAEAAQTIALQAFLEDQLRPVYPDDGAARTRYSKFWSTLVSLVAAIIAMWPLSMFNFSNLAIVLTSVMGGCFLLFLLGVKYYKFVDRIENPFKDVGVVINTAVAKRKVEYPQTQAGYFPPTREGLFDDSSDDVHISPRVPWLRWLDKAAIVTDAELAHHRPSVEQVRSVKFLLKMLPLWSCFLTFSLVVASGSTFFIEEASSLTADDDIRSILILDNLLSFTEFVVSETSTYVIERLRQKQKYNEQKMQLVRIGIGMACCVPCCIVAWATATSRQHDKERGSKNTMNVYLLTPQFLLLGLMAGLSEEGLKLFYESQVLVSLSTYGPPFEEFIMGFGKFLSILCILIFGNTQFKWFQSDLDNSRLNRYYMFLAVLSFVNAIIYCLAVCWYGDYAFILEDVAGEEMDPIAHLLDDGIGLASRSITEQGQHGSRGTLSHRIVPKPDSGDIIEESSGSGSKEEGPEEPLLATKKNSAYNYLLRLRMATTFLRLFSGAARRRADPTPLKKD